jgi:hypothetical protein
MNRGSLARNVRVTVFEGSDPAREGCERELMQRGISIPLSHRFASVRVAEWAKSRFIAVQSPDGAWVGGMAVHERPVKLMAGHSMLRVSGLGASVPGEVAEAAIAALAQWVRRDARVLRVNVELYSKSSAERAALGALLRRYGFRPAEQNNNYTETVGVDLQPSEDEIFNAFHRLARRNIRQVEKRPVRLGLITDPIYAGRIDAIARETMERTGGRHTSQDWKGRIELSALHADHARLIGLWRDDVTGPDSLVAFAWGCHHGQHAHYADAGADGAATRELRVAWAHPMMWDLIRWAKQVGAQWFDLGGITRGTVDDENDPLGGISHFKRLFNDEVLRVSEEWVLDTHNWRATLVNSVYRAVQKRAG